MMLRRIGAFYQKAAQRARRNRSLFTSFILSYLAILLIPMVGALSVFFPFRAGLEWELQRSNQLVAEQAKHIVEYALQNVKSSCMDFSQRERFASVQHITAPLSTADRYLISQMLMKDMGWSVGSNSYIDSYMVYFSKGDFVLTASSYMRPKECYEQYFAGTFSSYEDWREEFSTLAFPKVYDTTNKLVYYYTLSVGGTKPVATALVTINKQEMLRPVLAFSWISEGRLFVLDQDKQILLSNANPDEYDDLGLASFPESGVIKHNGERLVVSRTVSDVNDWEYVLVMDGDYLAAEQNRIQTSLLFYVLAVVVSGILLALLFSRRNYMPIKNVVKLISGVAPGAGTDNELAFLDASVRQIVRANADYQNQIAMQAGAIRQNMLSRILRRRIGHEGLSRERLLASGIDFPHEKFQVALFRIDDAQGFLLDLDEPAKQFPLDGMDQKLIYAIKQGIREEWAGYVCEINDRIACVVNFPKGDEATVVGCLEAVRTRVEEEFQVRMTLAVSLPHTTAVGLPTAYEEAGLAMESVAIRGYADTQFYSPNADDEGETNFLSKEMEHALSVALHSGNASDARQVLAEILQKGKNFSGEAYRGLTYSIATCFLRVLSTAGIHEADLMPQTLLKAVSKADGGNEALLLETAQKICGLLDAGKDGRNAVLLDRIIAYVRENYADPNLSNTKIAAAMDISPAYLSRFFKRQTGDGVLNYTNQLRMEAAKEIMKANAALTVSEVSALVGIENAATFIRAFKKHEGITPGRYMEIIHRP